MPEAAEAEQPHEVKPVEYVAAFCAYVVLGYVLKSVVLNWIVGPLFLVAVLYAFPTAFRRLRR